MANEKYQQYFAVGFGQFVRNACKQQSINATELGKRTGLSRSYCGKLMKPDPPPPQPTMATVHVICKALGFQGAKIMYALEMGMLKTADKPRVRAAYKTDESSTLVVEVEPEIDAHELIANARTH